MPPRDTQRCLGGMKTAKAAWRDSITAGSFRRAICICRRNMGGERDQASQSAFSSPVWGLLGLCIWSLWSSVHNGSFALKIGMATHSCNEEPQKRSASIRQQLGPCFLQDLSGAADLTIYLLQIATHQHVPSTSTVCMNCAYSYTPIKWVCAFILRLL